MWDASANIVIDQRQLSGSFEISVRNSDRPYESRPCLIIECPRPLDFAGRVHHAFEEEMGWLAAEQQSVLCVDYSVTLSASESSGLPAAQYRIRHCAELESELLVAEWAAEVLEQWMLPAFGQFSTSDCRMLTDVRFDFLYSGGDRAGRILRNGFAKLFAVTIPVTSSRKKCFVTAWFQTALKRLILAAAGPWRHSSMMAMIRCSCDRWRRRHWLSITNSGIDIFLR